MSTHTQRHEERKRKTAEENRREREATMFLEKKDQEKKLVDLRENTKENTEVVKDGNLKEVIEKSKSPVNTTEEERTGRDEATLRLIERIRREAEEEEKLKTDLKQESCH